MKTQKTKNMSHLDELLQSSDNENIETKILRALLALNNTKLCQKMTVFYNVIYLLRSTRKIGLKIIFSRLFSNMKFLWLMNFWRLFQLEVRNGLESK